MDTLATSGVGHSRTYYPLVLGQHITISIILTTLAIMDPSSNFGTVCLEQMVIMSNLSPEISQLSKWQRLKLQILKRRKLTKLKLSDQVGMMIVSCYCLCSDQ